MGSIINSIDLIVLYSSLELLGIFIGFPLLLIGLFCLLKMEFAKRSAVSLISLISIIYVALVVNDLSIRQFLYRSDAEVLVKEADQLWEYMKYRESYAKLENAINVAAYQRNDQFLIAGYQRITDRYFKQQSYQTAIEYTFMERELLKKSRAYLKKYEGGNNLFLDVSSENSWIGLNDVELEKYELSKGFYNRLHDLNEQRNDPFEEALFYSSVARTGQVQAEMDIVRLAYMRAINVISLSLETESKSLPRVVLGKYFQAISALEENLDNTQLAYDYSLKSIQYWDDFRPKIQAVRQAYKLGLEDEAHAFVDDIIETYISAGRNEADEIYVLEAASLEFSLDHLQHARKVYNNLQYNLVEQLHAYDGELARIDRDLAGGGPKPRSYLYPSLANVKNIRHRIENIGDHLATINFRYSEKAADKVAESRIAELDGELDQAVEFLYEAIDHAQNAEAQLYLYMYHVRTAHLLNKLKRYDEALDHALKARAVHNGDNFILVNSKPENDIAKHYPELLISQLGLGRLDDAYDTLEMLHDLGKSRVYRDEPNSEMHEYLKGKFLYFVRTGEMLRARLYYEDAVNYLLNSAEAMDVPLSIDRDRDMSFVNNNFEIYLIELFTLGDELFKSNSVSEFQ